MAAGNSINQNSAGITGFTGTAFTGTAVTNHAVIVGGSTSSTLTNVGPSATAGQILQSGGAAADPAYSTATYPATAGTSGKILISDGTNIVSSTPTYPNAASTALKHIRSDGTNFVTTTVTYPDASVTAGKVIISDGTNYIASTPTFPNTATGTGTLLRADGTNWVATTSTYPNTNAVNTLLYASSANVMSALATANNSIVLTDGSGVPSLGTSLSNDFTFTKATSGATTTLTVSNTSNTASSAANILAQVAGGTAADATHQATISGGQAWTWGLDNSDSDAFVIASSSTLGTTNVMRVATTGEINYPLQSAFLGYLPSNDLNKTGTGGSFTIGSATALTEVFDQNSDFNTNGTFTAPVTGRYYLSGQATLTGCTANVANITTIVTSNRNYSQNTGRAASATDLCCNISALADMDAADTATVTVQGFGEAGATDDVQGSATLTTSFSGFLAC